MEYITGVYALNHKVNYGKGDWHFKGVDWNRAKIGNTSKSVLNSKGVLEYNGEYIASVARALADLLMEHSFVWLKGIKTEFIFDDEVKQELFTYARELNDEKVDDFMSREYGTEYLTESTTLFTDYLRERGLEYVR